MSIDNLSTNTENNFEAQRFIREAIKTQDPESFENPILKRMADNQEKITDANEIARQAYDRMHHRHNRS